MSEHDVLGELPLVHAEEPPFLRPKVRTRMRRPRRSALGRLLLAVQVAGGTAACVALLWGGYSRVMASERLKVMRVDVRGGRFLSEGEVRQLLGPAVGENIFSLDLALLKERLKASPWVAEASVRRTLPDTLQVEIRERVPLALAEVDRLFLMDADGTLIELYGPRTAGFDLPIVRSLQGLDDEARGYRAGRAGELLAELGELAAEVSEVHVEPSGELRVVLRGGASEVLRIAPPYRGRFLTFLSLRRELNERCPRAEFFDLRYRDRIYAKEALETEAPKAAARARSPAPRGEPQTASAPRR